MLWHKIIATISAVRTRPIFVGSQSYGRAGSTSQVNVNFNLSDGTGETTPVAGDLVLLMVAAAADNSGILESPIDYTQLASFGSNSSNDARLYVGYKIMGTTPDTTFPVVSSLNIAYAQTAIVFVFRGASPSDILITTANAGGSRLANPPAISPVVKNTTVVAIGAAGSKTTAVTFTSGDLTNFKTQSSNDSQAVAIGAGYFEWTDGTYDPTAFGNSGSTGLDSWCAATVTISPA